MPGFLAIYTILHVVISLVAIAAGFVVMLQMIQRRESAKWTVLFLAMTILTSVTGFGFPITRITPGLVFGVISLIALGLALYARYIRRSSPKWRAIYIVTALLSQYLNVVVLIVQSFQKIPFLKALAPTQSESPFLATQVAALILFLFVGVLALFRHSVNSQPL